MVAIGEHAEFVLNPSNKIIRRSLNLIGTWYSTLPHAHELMQLALSGKINVRSFLTHTVTLDEVPNIFNSIVNYQDNILKCVIIFD
jgi:threonine dehydrogenase-like Zn-dependent dehydrogenase